jgi:DNA-binding transcriptional LysR family regulator
LNIEKKDVKQRRLLHKSKQWVGMDILKAMRVYVAIVETGSFVAAANQRDTSTAAISRHVAALENHLGARLLNRTTRRLSMTDVGQEFFNRAQAIFADVSEAEAIAGENATKPSGQLRISAPLSFGISKLSQWLPGFVARYPDLKLDIDLSDRLVDLATDGIDVAVRIGRQAASTNVVARRLGSIPLEICAAPDYLNRRGTPSSPHELSEHQTTSFSYLSTGDNWTLTNSQGRTETIRIKPSVHANNGDILRELAVHGYGIILQPSFIVEKDIAAGRLMRILEDWRLDDLNLYAIYLSRKFLSAKVRVFIDYLSEVVGS